MGFDEASQHPVLLCTGDSNRLCGVCELPTTEAPHYVLRLPLTDGNIYVYMHRHCARANGFGTDLDRVLIGNHLG